MKEKLKILGVGILCGFGWCIGLLQVTGSLPQRGFPLVMDVLGMAGIAVLALSVVLPKPSDS